MKDFMVVLKELLLAFANKVALSMMILVCCQVACSNGFLRVRRILWVSPLLTLDLRSFLNLRNWMDPLSQSFVSALNTCRYFFPSILSGRILLRRDGRHIFDFFKTLSLNDVSPPVQA